MAENGTDQFGSVVPGFKIRGMEPEQNVYDFLISVDVDFAEELRSLDVPGKQEGAAEHISAALTHDMGDVRFAGDSFLLRGITVGFQATGLDLYKEERGRQQFATHNVDTAAEAMEVIAAFSRWEDLASHLLEDRREDDGLRADGGMMEDDNDWTWEDVERLLRDLKADGYDPTLLETVTSAAAPTKSIQINVKRDVESGGDQ